MGLHEEVNRALTESPDLENAALWVALARSVIRDLTGSLATRDGELTDKKEENQRLRGLLLQHGIDPDTGAKVRAEIVHEDREDAGPQQGHPLADDLLPRALETVGRLTGRCCIEPSEVRSIYDGVLIVNAEITGQPVQVTFHPGTGGSVCAANRVVPFSGPVPYDELLAHVADFLRAADQLRRLAEPLSGAS